MPDWVDDMQALSAAIARQQRPQQAQMAQRPPPGVQVPPQGSGLPPGVQVPPQGSGLPPGVQVPPQGQQQPMPRIFPGGDPPGGWPPVRDLNQGAGPTPLTPQQIE